MSSVTDALARHAREQPEQRAVTGSREHLNWQQLHEEVVRLATALAGARVLATLLVNSPAWVVTDLAALRACVTHVPLPVFFSDSQLQHTLQDAAVDTLITDDPERIRALFPVTASDTLWIAGRRCARLLLDIKLPQAAAADAVAKVTYTSGTTGSPRGVRLSLETLETVASALARAAEATPADRAMALLPLSILLENIGTVYVPVLAGAQLLVPDAADTGVDGSSRVDAGRLAATLQTHRPTALIVPPGLLKLLTGLAQRHAIPDSLRYIAVGGAPAGEGLLEAAGAAGLPVYQGYGLSEAGSVVAVNTPTHNRPGSVGRLLPHVRALISEAGEIVLQGTTFSGYLGAEGRDPHESLATGDTGHFDADGYLYVTGRVRERIITSYGRNISPEWVEAELLAHNGIAQAAVIGNGRARLLAVLVPAGEGGDLAAAVAATNARLPDYAQIHAWLPITRPFTVASGELSPAGSPRRDIIEQHYFPLHKVGNR
ncbi:MAG: AMP-binding protein [Pseudomonadota bacterium]